MEGSGAAENLAAVGGTRDLESAMRIVAGGTRHGNETYRESIEIMYSSMGSHDIAEDIWRQATSQYRETLRAIAQHLHDHELLAPGLGVDAAADRLWFCFGLGAWRTLVKDCGWAWDEAERWLAAQAVRMLGEPERR